MANERARHLRKNQTDTEKRLWNALKQKQLDGCRFRRQHPMGNYIVDFVCLERRLIVELDGSQHGDPDHIAYDAKRDAFLESEGFHVVRLWNHEINENLDGVLLTISELLQTGKVFNP